MGKLRENSGKSIIMKVPENSPEHQDLHVSIFLPCFLRKKKKWAIGKPNGRVYTYISVSKYHQCLRDVGSAPHRLEHAWSRQTDLRFIPDW